MDDWADARERMAVAQLEARGIRDPRVLAAMRQVPRHLFVPSSVRQKAYDDRALPIDHGQTISQPFMVALMTAVLAEEVSLGRVLEIGTGSGYQAAVLSLMARSVVSIERQPGLAASARQRLRELGYVNVQILDGDGTAGVPSDAPYDGIMVTAGAPYVPEALVGQLADEGRLVIPVGSHLRQVLTVVVKRAGRISRREREGCIFVPLVGRHGWPDDRHL